MPVVESTTDVAARRVVVVSELAAPPERLWDLWASPDRLARWWGPAGCPMVVEHHDLRDGGQVRFHVLVADHTRIDARFEVDSADPPRGLRFTFHNGVLEPASVDVSIAPLADDLSRMTMTTTFPSDDAMRQAVELGFDEGVRRAAHQLDDALR